MILDDEEIITINQNKIKAAFVKERYMKLKYEHLEYLVNTLKYTQNKILNIRAFVLTAAYNVVTNMDAHYTALIDDGYSGTNINRPSFINLMEDVKQGKINCIIVKDLSRFLRDYILIGDYLENIFPFLNVRFISINDGYDSFKEKGNGTDLDIQFKSLLYDFYSKDVSDKIKTSMTIQKKQGKYLALYVIKRVILLTL